MIDAIQGSNYNGYTILQDQKKITPNEVESIQPSFDIKEILSQINEYTYTEKDKESVDRSLVNSLKEKFNIKEEDIYELYKNGIDLEKLNVKELAYRTNIKTHSLEADEEVEKMKENDKKLEEKIEMIKKHNANMYINALSSNKPITINSLYENNFKGNQKKGISQYQKEDIDNVLSMNGLQPNKSNRWAADLLMMYDMDVSPTSISKLQGIQAAVEALDGENIQVSGDDELVKFGLVQYQPEYVDRITDELGMVTDEHIEKLIEEGSEISIQSLRDSIHKHAQDALEDHTANQSFDQGQELSEEQLTSQVDEVKRQILQITTKLTTEAAQKISEKMPLESSSLKSVADALGQMEQEMAVSALEQVNLPVTKENIEAVTNVMNVVEGVSQHFMPAVQIELETNEAVTLNEMGVALASYMENETPVEARFGESIKTVEGQIKHLLESQSIATTTTNIEAAKALITNNIEVNAEQIQNIQDVVLKLNTFLEEMTPIQVASMIKEGFNPYHASVNEILSWMSKDKTEGLKTSVAEAIIALEQKGQINEEQKEGMIGLYRILQAVTKQKEEVMGYLFKNELPMTVENLQIATKYVRGKKHIEQVIDDNFGELEIATRTKKTASEMIESSNKQSQKTLEAIRVLENMALPITEESIHKVSKMSALIYPYIKEQFKATVGHFDGMSTLPDSFLEKLQEVQTADSQVVKDMLKQDIPLTLSNIYWMNKISHDPELYSELLNDKGMLKEGLPKDLEEIEETLKAIEEKVHVQKEESALASEWNEYRSYKQLEEIVHFQRQRIENEGLYQIPFMIDGERRMINLYVQEDANSNTSLAEGTHLKAVISYKTKSMGTVKAYLEMNGENLGYKIEAEHIENRELLKAHAESLTKSLNAVGYNVVHSEFGNEEEHSVTQNVKKHEDSLFEEMV